MMQRFRDRILDIIDELSHRRRRRRDVLRALPPPAIKGNMRSVLVVTPPDPMFSQAVFIMKDDYFKEPGLSREELLLQARAAADIYCGSVAPARIRGRALPYLLTAAASGGLTLLILRIGGMI